MPIKNVARESMRDIVYHKILEMITTGEWKRGSKIPSESQLSKEFGISRLTIREALQKLSSLGIIESRQGEGTFVRELDGSQYLSAMIPFVVLEKTDLLFMLEFRKIIEGSSAYFAALRAEEADIAFLQENLETMRGQMDDLEARTLLDIAFHFGIAKATHNPIITRIFEILKDTWLTNMRSIVQTMGSSQAIFYHGEILKALVARDGNRARSLMDAHIDSTIDAMQIEALRTEQQFSEPVN